MFRPHFLILGQFQYSSKCTGSASFKPSLAMSVSIERGKSPECRKKSCAIGPNMWRVSHAPGTSSMPSQPASAVHQPITTKWHSHRGSATGRGRLDEVTGHQNRQSQHRIKNPLSARQSRQPREFAKKSGWGCTTTPNTGSRAHILRFIPPTNISASPSPSPK